jgi:Tol biopolymer transport system component
VYYHGKYIDISKGIYDSSTPAFSSSGHNMAYAAYRGEQGIEPIYGINLYDFASRRTATLTSPKGQSDWSPAWSTDDSYLAFVRSKPQEAMYMGSGQIWTVSRNGARPRWSGAYGRQVQWVS